MDTPYFGFQVLFWAVMVALAIGLGRIIARRFLPQKNNKGEEPQATPISTTPPGSVMEHYVQVKRERRGMGLCLYCDEPATHYVPFFQVVRSWLDPLLLYLGVNQKERWRVVVDYSGGVPDLCMNHHERCRGLMEERLAKHSSDDKKFEDGERKDLYEYQVATIFEIMSNDMKLLRTKKSKIPKAVPNLQSLPGGKAMAVVNGNGN